MAEDKPIQTGNQPVELGQLLANTIASVVKAQEQLDVYAAKRTQAYEEAEAGELVLPPLWYTFSKVDVEMELSADIRKIQADSDTLEPHIFSRTLNPASVGLYGYQASSGLRVRVEMSPQGMLPIKAAENT
ncbi:MAG: hypothetical protein QNJ78_12310 [Gammaproteobacteria bacterium]|nr:hypothetical protein [Gammaproteobacteria bacterium]